MYIYIYTFRNYLNIYTYIYILYGVIIQNMCDFSRRWVLKLGFENQIPMMEDDDGGLEDHVPF